MTRPTEAIERLEELAKAVLDWRPLPDTATTRAMEAALGRADSESRHRVLDAFRDAANPQAILSLIAHLHQVEEENAGLREAATTAHHALLGRTPHSVPNGEEACEALRQALTRNRGGDHG